MAKTANSKVIFLPATNQTVQNMEAQMALADQTGEGPSRYRGQAQVKPGNQFNVNTDDGFQQAMNARVIENI
jgi:hypothetical protein